MFPTWCRGLGSFKLFSLGYTNNYDQAALVKITKAANYGKISQFIAGESIEYIISATDREALKKAYVGIDEALKIEKRLIEKRK